AADARESGALSRAWKGRDIVVVVALPGAGAWFVRDILARDPRVSAVSPQDLAFDSKDEKKKDPWRKTFWRAWRIARRLGLNSPTEAALFLPDVFRAGYSASLDCGLHELFELGLLPAPPGDAAPAALSDSSDDALTDDYTCLLSALSESVAPPLPSPPSDNQKQKQPQQPHALSPKVLIEDPYFLTRIRPFPSAAALLAKQRALLARFLGLDGGDDYAAQSEKALAEIQASCVRLWTDAVAARRKLEQEEGGDAVRFVDVEGWSLEKLETAADFVDGEAAQEIRDLVLGK
ncbi:hypothetical protein DFJ73DRAFT_802231, partial [Zopfochytrium polystomum]